LAREWANANDEKTSPARAPVTIAAARQPRLTCGSLVRSIPRFL